MKIKTVSIALLALICSVIAVTPPARAQNPTTLATFNTTDEANPVSDVTLIDSTLYGTTNRGEANDDGTVFSVPVGGGTLTNLVGFNNTNGSFESGDTGFSADYLNFKTQTSQSQAKLSKLYHQRRLQKSRSQISRS